MMREIKFRAWDKQNKRMVPQVGVNPFFVDDLDRFHWHWDEVEVMQYTGLKDKNKAPIYEGDIVRQHFCKEVGSNYYEDTETLEGFHIGEIVVIASKGVCIKDPLLHLEVDGEIEQELAKTKMYKPVASYRCEVIGNVYENPELLGV